MKNWPENEEEVVNRLAGIEILLDQLNADFQATTWRKSSLVEQCIKSAREELKLSIEKFITKETDESVHLANLAWLHVDFGRRLIDAETTEGLLGHGHFLELGNDKTAASTFLATCFTRMEQQVIKLRQSITQRSKANDK